MDENLTKVIEDITACLDGLDKKIDVLKQMIDINSGSILKMNQACSEMCNLIDDLDNRLSKLEEK